MEVTGGWRELRNELYHVNWRSISVIKCGGSQEDEIGGTCWPLGTEQKCVSGFWWILEYVGVDGVNNEMDLEEVVSGCGQDSSGSL